jgi:hypothetical protein
MPEGSEGRLSLRQAYQVRDNLYVINDELEFIRDQLVRRRRARACCALCSAARR